MAVFYAICCLAFSAGNDFVFKLFARKKRSRGIFATLIGISWFAAMCVFEPLKWNNLPATILWGSLSGFFSIAANLLLIEAMGLQSAGICSTIYRLNLVPTAFAAWLILGESLTPEQWIGIGTAVIAVLCFMNPPEKEMGHRRARARIGNLLVVFAALLRAGMGIAYKYGFQHHADPAGVMMINALFWFIGGAAYVILRERKQISIDGHQVFYGVLSGFFVAAIVWFMAAALQAGNAGVVLPIAQMSFPVTLILSVIFLKESVTKLKLAGIGFGIVSVLLLSLPLHLFA